MKLIEQFRIPKEAYDRYTTRTKNGFKTYYRFHYTDTVLSSMVALQIAYTDYMRNNTGFDYFNSKNGTFYRQLSLIGGDL